MTLKFGIIPSVWKLGVLSSIINMCLRSAIQAQTLIMLALMRYGIQTSFKPISLHLSPFKLILFISMQPCKYFKVF
jgi:hypothetical protein